MVQGARNGFPQRLAGLLKPTAYPHAVQRVKLVTTHLSWVLVAGERAYKIKRPVTYPFADFSSVELRRHYCDEELRLNARCSPAIYERVARVTADAGGARIDGSGPVIDHAVVMQAFRQSDVLAELVAAGEATEPELGAFGASLARMHAGAQRPETGGAAGTPVAVAAAIGRNISECLAATRVFGNQSEVALVGGELRNAIGRLEPEVDARRNAGRVCEGHGDLHMGNIVRFHGALHAFDTLEFEPSFRWADVAQDVAFLVADLRAAGQRGLAQAFLNGYLQHSGDYGLLAVLDLYVADRALVRAKVMALLAAESPTAHALHEANQHAYLRLASESLARHQPACLLMHGPSGSGKTWLAQRLAGRAQAAVVRSDIERRRLSQAVSRHNDGRGLYGAEAVKATYARLRKCADDALRHGQSVLLDATYGQRAERARVADLCRSLGVPLVVIDCQAPEEVLAQRISARRREGDDASDATIEVLRKQLRAMEPIDPAEQLVVVEADTRGDDADRAVLWRLRSLLREQGQPEPAGAAAFQPGQADRNCA